MFKKYATKVTEIENYMTTSQDDNKRLLICRDIVQGVQKVTQPMGKCNINLFFYYYAYFL
jgi:glycerol-3-phosphate responsive antiterminator